MAIMDITQCQQQATAISLLDWLRVLQFGDSTLPIGAFSFSHGLESAIANGVVHDRNTLQDFVQTALEQAATSDGIALLCAWRAAAAGDLSDVLAADSHVFNRKLNEEVRMMTVRTGKKLMTMALRAISDETATPLLDDWRHQIEEKKTPGTFPVCLAVVFAALQLPPESALMVHQYGVAMAILGAALRLMKVDHLETQSILFQVNKGIELTWRTVEKKTLDDMASFAPTIDLLAAIHVKAHVRLFMN